MVRTVSRPLNQPYHFQTVPGTEKPAWRSAIFYHRFPSAIKLGTKPGGLKNQAGKQANNCHRSRYGYRLPAADGSKSRTGLFKLSLILGLRAPERRPCLFYRIWIVIPPAFLTGKRVRFPNSPSTTWSGRKPSSLFAHAPTLEGSAPFKARQGFATDRKLLAEQLEKQYGSKLQGSGC